MNGKKICKAQFYEIAQFDRSRRAEQHIKNLERHQKVMVFRKKAVV